MYIYIYTRTRVGHFTRVGFKGVLERSEDLEEFRKGPKTSEELQKGPKTSRRRSPQSRGALAAAMQDVNEPVEES